MRLSLSPRPMHALTTGRTGLLGRLARLLLAGVAVVSLLSIVDQGGPAVFRDPAILGELSVWFLTVVMLALFTALAGALAVHRGPAFARRVQAAALAGLGAVLLTAALIGAARFGAVWGVPLGDVVWWFDVIMLVETIVALVLAVLLGTPGCEVGVWRELFVRTRTQAPGHPPWIACVAGLHLLDAWEASRRGNRTGAGESMRP